MRPPHPANNTFDKELDRFVRDRIFFPPNIVMALLVLLLYPATLHADPVLKLSVTHPILPVVQGVSQKIEIELSSSTLQAGEEHTLSIASRSGMGVMQLPGGPAGKGELRCKIGERIQVAYRWAGAMPTEHAIAEKITVSAPDLGLTNTVDFSIGVDMRVTEIHVPQGAESGKFQAIDLVVRDILHPDADPIALLQNTGATPEVKIALLRDGSNTPATPAQDTFVTKFLGQTAAPQKEIVFPGGNEYKAGHLRKTESGQYIWTSIEGRAPGFTAPAAGDYYIKASFKPGTGGIAVRETTSPLFGVTGSHIPGSDIPGFMGSTVRIVAAYTPETIPQLTHDVQSALQQGQKDQAASLLGAGMKKIGVSSPVHVLGRYVETLAESQTSIEEISSYIQNFLRGYGGYGVLIVSRSGVASWNAVSPDKAALSTAPKNLVASVPAQARLYVGDRYLVIPFETGKNFTLNLTGSNKGSASLWKIIPEGVNRKNYPQGDWEKEISVHGGQLLPPAK